MLRRLLLVLTIAFTASAFLVADVAPGTAEMQLAQSGRKKPGLFERLFGKKVNPPQIFQKKRTTTTTKRAAPTRRSTTSRSTTRRSASRRQSAPAVQAEKVEPKDPDARKILVIGDFVASGLAWGMDQQFADERKIAVFDEASPSSGLVRADHYDWNEELLGILNEVNPDVVVISLGANDRQGLSIEGETYQLRDAAWEATYGQRVDSLLDTLSVYGRPFFWQSVPPLRGQSATTDMAYLNSIYQPLVKDAGGYFVDVWNGFTNADGQYVATGPDLDGQTRALRTSDGINFTRAGQIKLAFYVTREIRRRTGIGTGTIDLLPSATQASTIEIGPDGKKRLVGPVISLSDPLPGADDALAGPPDPVTFDPVSGDVRRAAVQSVADLEEDTARHRLIVKGEALTSPPGRVDDFAWPPSSRQGQAFVSPEEASEDAAEAEDAAAPEGS